MKIFLTILILIGLVVSGLQILRWRDNQTAERIKAVLTSDCLGACGVYDPAMLADQPEPVRRYFDAVIQPGTPLRSVVLLEMEGEIGLGTKDQPNYMPMRARQVLAPPKGLVWELEAGTAPMKITGSDGALGDQSWTRFWLAGTVPVARAYGPDHARAAFGRVVAEAAFWSPASLLPGPGVIWSAPDENTIAAVIEEGGFRQDLTLTLSDSGLPETVVIQRWTNANPEKIFQLQPFGGELSDFREVNGFLLPFHVEGGNFFGTNDYFPFFKAKITSARFPGLTE